jgi:hypothetical protein
LFSWRRQQTSGFVSNSGIKATLYGNERVCCMCAFEWFEDSERDIRTLEMIYGVGSEQLLKIANSYKS